MKNTDAAIVSDSRAIKIDNEFPTLFINAKKIVISSDDLSIDMVIEHPKDIKFRSITINGVEYFRNEPTEEVGKNINEGKLATEKTNKFIGSGWPYECRNPEYPLQTPEEAAQLFGKVSTSATTLHKLNKNKRKDQSNMQSRTVTLASIMEANTTSDTTEWILCDIVSGRTQCFTAYTFAKDAAEFHDERKDSVYDWFVYGVGGYGLEIIYRGNH